MTSPLFQPLRIRSLELPNRIVMSPMTRTYSIEGVPGQDVADYYRRRAEGGTGLIVTEGVAIDHVSAVDHANVPNLHPAAQAGWRRSSTTFTLPAARSCRSCGTSARCGAR